MYVETHPFEEFIPKGATALIVGSFPPVKLTAKPGAVVGENKHLYDDYFSKTRNQKSKDFDIDFYYGSRENNLWDIIGHVYNEQLDSETKIKCFLKRKLIGVTDVIESCQRKPVKGVLGSSDEALKIIEPRKILNTINKHDIKTIYFTSRYVFEKLFKENKEELVGRKVVILISPSNAANQSIGRSQDYKDKKKKGIVTNTKEYRIQFYKDTFAVK